MKVQELFNLENKVAIVTGGARGIGRFIANGLAEAGADVVIASRKIDNCVKAAEEIERLGVQVLPVQCDLENPEDINELMNKTISRFKKIDVLFNNAGLTWGAPTLEYPLEKWNKIINVNLRGVFLLSQNVAKIMMKSKKGKIVNITSIMATCGATEEMSPAVAYNASKGGVNALTYDLAIKFAKYNITVNGIAPGYFDTDMASYFSSDKETCSQYLAKIPLERLGKEDDIKGAAVFLASEASNYLTGHIVNIDGGYLSW